MPEVPLLGSTTATTTDETPFVEAVTAFLVYKRQDGLYAISTDINIPITVERAPSPDELWQAVAKIKKDIEMQETAMTTAQITVQAQMQMAHQMREAQQNQQLIGSLGNIK